jgi:hypothetical protein
MHRSFPFGAFLLSIVIFLFLLIAHPATLAQSSAALSNAPAIPSGLAQKVALAGVPNAGKMNDFLLGGVQPSNHGLAELNSRFLRFLICPPW